MFTRKWYALLILPALVACSSCRLRLRDEWWHEPVADGNVASVKKSIQSGKAVDSLDENGDTPLVWAVQHERKEMVEMLVTSGADIKHQNNWGRSVADCVERASPEFQKWWESKYGKVPVSHGTR